MKTLWHVLILVLLFLMTVVSCKHNARTTNDWITKDDVHIAVDETFQPIAEELIEVFSSRHPEATMYPVYCSEDSALHLLTSDSLRLAFVTRKLTENEQNLIASHKLKFRQDRIATDAIALIVNKNNPDTLITVDELKGIVSGRITRWEQLERGNKKGELKLVFDNSGSSTVRFMRDSLCNGEQLSGNLFAQGTNLAVIEAVKENPDIIGVVGTDWVRAESDSALSSFSNLDVRVMMVSKKSGKEADYFRPYQYYIATGDYPLLRTVYIITTEPRMNSMAKNCFFFLKGQVGQKIICNGSQLLPYSPVQVRNVNVN